ncbi:hypothetical protein QBC46DRAFT_385900 [Diplogelasinospora grovesii]|uniref:Uncharacterized protein n=1 Tax=Diplogelasinospora grovesii TaxID=303347 RepID=A0AAN6N7D7_9PEZI|nr:hypothetical protein QBC46DRAFT_385900 [Diplogelasinospora grovesii]
MPSHSFQVDGLEMGTSKPACPSSFPASDHSSALFSGTMTSPPTTMTTVSASSSSDSRESKNVRKSKDSLSYQVTLDMVCTGAQIEAVMTSLEGVGMSVSMKVQPKSRFG